jgi:hypothetical protein
MSAIFYISMKEDTPNGIMNQGAVPNTNSDGNPANEVVAGNKNPIADK